MPAARDIVIVGGGHNGLIAAALLARSGFRPLLLERDAQAGGCARTAEIAPGFRCPTLAHLAAIDPAIVRTLALERHGLQVIRPPIATLAPARDGHALALWADAGRAVESIKRFSASDAGRYRPFMESFARISTVLRALQSAPPPAIDDARGGDVLSVLKAARAFRALPKSDAYRLLRWMPMPVGDLVREWFDSEPLCAAIAAGGLIGSHLAPRSAGSGGQLLMLGAGEADPLGGGWFAAGGTGAVGAALARAAREAGAEIRTGADVAQINVAEGTARGVVLATGEEIPASAVVSGLDPKRTFLALIDPVELGPGFRQQVQNIRARGMLAKINYAVSALPPFPTTGDDRAAALSGRIRLGASLDAVERAFDMAKYGSLSDDPWMEITIPSLSDPDLAPAGCHVLSAYLQYAPYMLRGTTWDAERERLGEIADQTIGSYARGFEGTIVARQVLTPLDLERRHGLTGGHIFHGELVLDQFFIARPLLGCSRYATPIRNLFLCGSGTHPGTGLDGRSGALAAREIARRLRR